MIRLNLFIHFSYPKFILDRLASLPDFYLNIVLDRRLKSTLYFLLRLLDAFDVLAKPYLVPHGDIHFILGDERFVFVSHEINCFFDSGFGDLNGLWAFVSDLGRLPVRRESNADRELTVPIAADGCIQELLNERIA